MSVITEKLQLLKCPKEMYDNAFKFISSLTVVTLEEIKEIIDYLTLKGIAKEEEGKPLIPVAAFQILPLGLTEIKTRVEQMESLGHIACYIDKPARINIRDAHLRIAYMLKQGDPVINEKGKYVKTPFDKKLFNDKYGNVDLSLALGESASIENMAGEIDKPIDFGETIPDVKEEVKPVVEATPEDPFVEKVEPVEPATVNAEEPVTPPVVNDVVVPPVPEMQSVETEPVPAPEVEMPVTPPDAPVETPAPSQDVVTPPEVNDVVVPPVPVVDAPVPDVPATEMPVTPPDVQDAPLENPAPSQDVVTPPEVNDSVVSEVPTPDAEPAPVPETPVEPSPVDDGRLEKIEYILSGLYSSLFGMNEVDAAMLERATTFAQTSDKNPEDLVYELVTMESDYNDEAKTMIQKAILDISASAPSVGGR